MACRQIWPRPALRPHRRCGAPAQVAPAAADDRYRRCDRPTDDRGDAAPSDRIVVEVRTAKINCLSERSVANLQPRQRRRARATETQDTASAVGAANVGKRPRSKDCPVLFDFERVPEHKLDGMTAARGAVIKNSSV